MTSTTGQPRVLLLAEAANPEWVSVPLLGWSMYQALAQVTPVHLVTQVRNRPAMVRAGLVEGRDFTAIDTEKLAGPIWKIASLLRGGKGKGFTTITALQSLIYFYFEHLVWKRFAADLRAHHFDVVHRLTPLTPTAPSPLASKCARLGLPFVLGPLNGGVPWPKAYDNVRRAEKEWLSYIRDAYKCLPGYHSTRRHASAILIASGDTWQQMPAIYHRKCIYMVENAYWPERFTRPAQLDDVGSPATQLRVAFAGRLVPYKGADIVIEAAREFVLQGKIKVDIYGDGPQLPLLRELVQRENLASGVTLHGWVEQKNLAGLWQQAQLFAFPSIREFGGAVAMESMALGVPPAVVDYGGPPELVGRDSGYLIPIGPREQLVHSYRQLFEHVLNHREELRQKREAGWRRAEHYFTWPAKARQMMQVYEWVTHRRPDKPDFGMPYPELQTAATQEP